ncbi:MAG: FG-GAP repeat protein [Myxococcota bacterium]
MTASLTKTRFFAIVCCLVWIHGGCFAPVLPDEPPVGDIELSVVATGKPKELRFSWEVPPRLREDIDLFLIERDVEGHGAFQAEPAFQPIPRSQTDAVAFFPVHLTRWSTTEWRVTAIGTTGDAVNVSNSTSVDTPFRDVVGYFKASNPGVSDLFGDELALSGDGETLAVGAPSEDSGSRGVNADGEDNEARDAGAVYLFRKIAGTWIQEAYLKASNAAENDFFGTSVSLSSDGRVLVVGAPEESSRPQGPEEITDNPRGFSRGAAYVFERGDSGWQQVFRAKSRRTGNANFTDVARRVAIDRDGGTLALGAPGDSSGARGVNQEVFEQDDRDNSGAVFLFRRGSSGWIETAYIKASNADAGDRFGQTIALSQDGRYLIAGAPNESSSAATVNGDESLNDAESTGAAYVFWRTTAGWEQQAYLKVSNADPFDRLGDTAIAVSADGSVVVIGVILEDGGVYDINGDPSDNSAVESGAAYIFRRDGESWMQEAYLKASDGSDEALFGFDVDITADGESVFVSAPRQFVEDDGEQLEGAVYTFRFNGMSWSEMNRVVSSNASDGDGFGGALSLSDDGEAMAVGAVGDSSNATGVGGDATDNSLENAGAVYLY